MNMRVVSYSSDARTDNSFQFSFPFLSAENGMLIDGDWMDELACFHNNLLDYSSCPNSVAWPLLLEQIIF